MSHKILPVIHHLSDGLSIDQAELAFSHGADGIFLISHHAADEDLPWVATTLKREFPNKLIGMNLLYTDPVEALQIVIDRDLDALWTDYCGIHSSRTDETAYEMKRVRESTTKSVAVYGAAAFKYQREEPEPGRAAELVTKFGFIATTSGPGTGHAPDVEKIQTMRRAIGLGATLAVASGMTPENVSAFKPYVDDFLVSTGISKDGYRFDPDRLASFVRVVRSND